MDRERYEWIRARCNRYLSNDAFRPSVWAEWSDVRIELTELLDTVRDLWAENAGLRGEIQRLKEKLT